MADKYRCLTEYGRNDITTDPGDMPRVEVILEGMVVAVLSPEEFDAQYELIVE